MVVSWKSLVVLLLTAAYGSSLDRWSTLSDKDIDRIAEQWEEEDEEDGSEGASSPSSGPTGASDSTLDEDELLKLSLADRPAMLRVTLAGQPRSRRETEDLTKRWQLGLLNANIPTERYYVNEQVVIYMTHQGERGVEVKNFLVKQPECDSVRVANQEYPCVGSTKEEL